MSVPTDTWEEWQKDYRFGVVLMFPPEPVMSLVNGLRERFDPRSHASSDAHISLTVALPRELSAEALRELATVTACRAPLHVRYGPPKVYPLHPGVALQIEPQSELRQLVTDLEAAPPFRGVSARQWPFSAHMTIAEFVDWDASATIMGELVHDELVGEFTCSYLSVAVPDDAFHFTERHRLVLGTAAQR